jgi:hypothetical protein
MMVNLPWRECSVCAKPIAGIAEHLVHEVQHLLVAEPMVNFGKIFFSTRESTARDRRNSVGCKKLTQNTRCLAWLRVEEDPAPLPEHVIHFLAMKLCKVLAGEALVHLFLQARRY